MIISLSRSSEVKLQITTLGLTGVTILVEWFCCRNELHLHIEGLAAEPLILSESDQVQISPVASPVILHHTVWRTWPFIAYSDWKMILVPVLTTSLIHFYWKGWENVLFELGIERVNPSTPKSDQVQISPVASPVILHHTVWRTWPFIACSDWKMILVPVLTTSLIHFSWKGWENVLFELGIDRVNPSTLKRGSITKINFSCSLTRNITSHSLENSDFHTLLRRNIHYATNSH